MSRVGKMPIEIPSGVKVDIKDRTVTIQGPLGKLEQVLRSEITPKLEESKLLVVRSEDTAMHKALHGLYQRLLSNMVIGVTKGFQKELKIIGVGYRAKLEGKSLALQLGFSHTIKFPIPQGIEIAVAENTKITVKGIDKQLVGEVAAEIRRYYPPEPYKGKGIRYVDEHVRRKAGKAVGGKGATK